MKLPDPVNTTICGCFFPKLPAATQVQIAELLNDGYFDGRHVDRIFKLAYTDGLRLRESQIRRFLDFISFFRSSLDFARGSLHPDILNEFPAQRLIQTCDDVSEPVDWSTFWRAHGGRLLGTEMVALKWDRIWWNISFVGVPVPPFQLGSRMDLEDVDRDEAENLGLLNAATVPPAVILDVDINTLRRMLSNSLASLG